MGRSLNIDRLEKYENDDFIALVDSKFGWAHRDQIKSILEGEDLAEQNENALKDIANFARQKGEIELYKDIQFYLDEMEGERED